MRRFRNAVMAVAVGTGAMGCALSQSHVAHYSIWHCDECDDFPTPAYGPGYSMMPGTYTGAVPSDRADANQSTSMGAAADLGSAPPPQQTPAPAAPATATPPVPPAANPGLGASNRPQPGAVTRVTSRPDTNVSPGAPATVDDLRLPVARP